MPSTTVGDALHDSKECLLWGYNRHQQQCKQASVTLLVGVVTNDRFASYMKGRNVQVLFCPFHII